MNASAARVDADFDELDACHRQIHAHLDRLAALAAAVQTGDLNPALQAEAAAIEVFFSSTSRQHHADEEANVFPPLLRGGSAELASAVRTLQQDHGWIEENWIELAPQLRAMAEGNHWVEPAEFLHGAEVFLDLCKGHIALEETLIYPQSKARWAQAVAQRQARSAPTPRAEST
jgi:hemerythrin-like domain-containing protein